MDRTSIYASGAYQLQASGKPEVDMRKGSRERLVVDIRENSVIVVHVPKPVRSTQHNAKTLIESRVIDSGNEFDISRVFLCCVSAGEFDFVSISCLSGGIVGLEKEIVRTERSPRVWPINPVTLIAADAGQSFASKGVSFQKPPSPPDGSGG